MTLMGGDSGVFLGIERPDWAITQPPSARSSVYAVTGDNISAAAGRVSFVLGLQGPCSSVDTVLVLPRSRRCMARPMPCAASSALMLWRLR